MSIFDNTFTEPGWNCTVAEKIVTRDQHHNYVNMGLVYEREDRIAEIKAVYAVNPGGKISKVIPVRVMIRVYIKNDIEEEEVFKRKLSATREEDMTEEMIKDIHTANKMFDLAEEDVRRVYL